MTKEEAIDVLKNTAWLGADIAERVYPAVDMAVEALENQIPKPPKVFEAHPKPVILCPSCGSTFVERSGVPVNYCNNC